MYWYWLYWCWGAADGSANILFGFVSLEWASEGFRVWSGRSVDAGGVDVVVSWVMVGEIGCGTENNRNREVERRKGKRDEEQYESDELGE